MSERHHQGTSGSPGTADLDTSKREQDPEIPNPNDLSTGPANLLSSIKGRRILVVVDEILLAGELAEDIEEHGGEVVGPAYGISDALRICGKSEIDAAILDINLNGQEVFPVSDLLLGRGIPFVFHTGTIKGPSALKLYDGVPVVSRPSLTVNLLKALDSVLGD